MTVIASTLFQPKDRACDVSNNISRDMCCCGNIELMTGILLLLLCASGPSIPSLELPF